jgi:hypothetical protein
MHDGIKKNPARDCNPERGHNPTIQLSPSRGVTSPKASTVVGLKGHDRGQRSAF